MDVRVSVCRDFFVEVGSVSAGLRADLVQGRLSADSLRFLQQVMRGEMLYRRLDTRLRMLEGHVVQLRRLLGDSVNGRPFARPRQIKLAVSLRW